MNGNGKYVDTRTFVVPYNGAKTIPFGVAHTYMAYIREYLFSRGGGGVGPFILCQASQASLTGDVTFKIPQKDWDPTTQFPLVESTAEHQNKIDLIIPN